MFDESDESEDGGGGERRERRRKDSGASEQQEEEVTAQRLSNFKSSFPLVFTRLVQGRLQTNSRS